MENKFTKNTGNFIKNNKGFKNIGHVATNNLNNARPQNLSDATNVTRPTMSSTDATMHSFAQSSNNNVIHNAAEQVIQNLNSSVQESATVANNIYNEQEQSNMRSSAEYRFSGNNKTTSFAENKSVTEHLPNIQENVSQQKFTENNEQTISRNASPVPKNTAISAENKQSLESEPSTAHNTAIFEGPLHSTFKEKFKAKENTDDFKNEAISNSHQMPSFESMQKESNSDVYNIEETHFPEPSAAHNTAIFEEPLHSTFKEKFKAKENTDDFKNEAIPNNHQIPGFESMQNESNSDAYNIEETASFFKDTSTAKFKNLSDKFESKEEFQPTFANKHGDNLSLSEELSPDTLKSTFSPGSFKADSAQEIKMKEIGINSAADRTTKQQSTYHKNVKVAFEGDIKNVKWDDKGQQHVGIKADIKFDDKKQRGFVDRTAGMIGTVEQLQEAFNNEESASNADDIAAAVLDIAVSNVGRTGEDYASVERGATKDIKHANKATRREDKKLAHLNKKADKLEGKFKEAKENGNFSTEKLDKLSEKFQNAQANFNDEKMQVEFNRNHVDPGFCDNDEFAVKKPSEQPAKADKKEPDNSRIQLKNGSDNPLKKKDKESDKTDINAKFHTGSPKFKNPDNFFEDRSNMFNSIQNKRMFIESGENVPAIPEKNLPAVGKNRNELSIFEGENVSANLKKRSISATKIDTKFENPTTVTRKEKIEMDRAKKKAAKKEKRKAYRKMAAVAGLSKFLKVKGAMQNDAAREGNPDDLLASGQSTALKELLSGLNPLNILKGKIRTLGIKLLGFLLPVLLIAFAVIIPVTVVVTAVSAVVNASDDGDTTYDPANPDLFENGDGKEFSSLSDKKIDTIIKKLYKSYPTMTDEQETVLRYALSKVGCPYNQAYHARTDVDIFDCSSLAYRSYKEIGVDISYCKATSAAEEARGLIMKNKTISGDYEPGDLIFWGNSNNGRYLGIYHVAIYVGNGKMVEARGTKWGVMYADVRNNQNIVAVCRPR